MESLPGTGLWALVATLLTALLVLAALRWVPPGHFLVATRRGVVARVAGPGLFVRVPLVDQVVVMPAGPEELPLVAHGTTRDGTEVRVLATARVRLVAPVPTEPYADRCGPAGLAAEQVLVDAVGGHDVDALSDALARTWDEVVAEADRACRPLGLEVLGLRLDELDAVLTGSLTGPPTSRRARGPE